MEFAKNDTQRALIQQLLDDNQGHIFETWKKDSPTTEQLNSFFKQVGALNSSYPGGLQKYVRHAKELLLDSKRGKSAFDGWTPAVPKGNILTEMKTIIEAERIGLPLMSQCAFVLVAGGLGERLGYSSIKVELPVDLCTGNSYLQQYTVCS